MVLISEILRAEKQKGKGSKKKLKELIKNSKIITERFRTHIWKYIIIENEKRTQYIFIPNIYILNSRRKLETYLIFENENYNYFSTKDKSRINKIKEQNFRNEPVGIKLKDPSKSNKLSNYSLKLLSDIVWKRYKKQYDREISLKLKLKEEKEERKLEDRLKKERLLKIELRKQYKYKPEKCRFQKPDRSMFSPTNYICNNPKYKSVYKNSCVVEIKRLYIRSTLQDIVYWEYPQHCKYFKGHTEKEKEDIKNRDKRFADRFIKSIMNKKK